VRPPAPRSLAAPALELRRLGAAGLARLALEKLPLLGLSAASSALTLWAQSSCGSVSDLGALPLGARLSNALESTVLYVWKSVWPTGLCVPYPHPALEGLDVAWRPATWGAAAALGLATLGALLAARSRPWWSVGWFWFVGMLAPVIGIVQVGAQRMADRYAYLPQLGLLVALVFGLRQAFPGERAGRVLVAAGLAAAAALSVLTVRQVALWKDTVTLLEHTLEVTGENPVAHANLGIAYLERGDHARAVHHLRARLASQPSASMLVNLGVALAREGDELAAIEAFREAARLSPRLFDAHANLGSLLLARGEAREALEHLELAARERPGSKPVQEALAAARAALDGR
jgi:Flp pilus assembly protein TadD